MAETTGAIYAAMAAVMRDVEAVTKDRRNTQQGYQFRGIDDMYNALHGILAKHGVFTVPTVLEIQRTERESKSGGLLTTTLARVQYRFYVVDGSYVDAVTEGEGMDSGDKSCNKALAGAHKYALVQTFAIPTESGDDSENENPEPVPPKPDTPPKAQRPSDQMEVLQEIAKLVNGANMTDRQKDLWRQDVAKARTLEALVVVKESLERTLAMGTASDNMMPNKNAEGPYTP